MSSVELFFVGFGAVVTVAGVIAFIALTWFRPGGGGQTTFKFLQLEVRVPHAATIVLAGIVLMVLPLVVGQPQEDVQVTLTASASPPDGGVVRGGGNHRAGSEATVEATSNSGWEFTGWTIACAGVGPCVVTMNGNQQVIAHFTQQRFTLTTSASPSEGGTVTDGGSYPSGSILTVAAKPSSGYAFKGWSGACSDTGSCTITVDADKSVTADFSRLETGTELFTLTASASPPDGGVVTGGGNHRAGSEATVEATSNSGWEFTGWTIACAGVGPCVVTMNENQQVIAHFTQQLFTLTASASPSEGGTVTDGGSYPSGSILTVAAKPSSGYAFKGWSGACSGTGSCTITVDADKSVTAFFTRAAILELAIFELLSPTDGQIISGRMIFSSDVSGVAGVHQVDYFVDGELYSVGIVGPNFRSSVFTTRFVNGEHMVQAKAVDAAGAELKVSDTVSIRVAN